MVPGDPRPNNCELLELQLIAARANDLVFFFHKLQVLDMNSSQSVEEDVPQWESNSDLDKLSKSDGDED